MKKADALNILGLTGNPTDDEIKAAHRKQIRKHHPDRFVDPTQKKEAEEKTKLINEARDVLTNGTWEPDFGPRNPYYRPGNTGGSTPGGYSTGQNPFVSGFGDVSLEELLRQVAQAQRAGGRASGPGYTYVWTSWDDVARGGSRTSSTSGTAGQTGFSTSSRPGQTHYTYTYTTSTPGTRAGGSGNTRDPFDPFAGFGPFDFFSDFFGGAPRPSREDFKRQAIHQRDTFFKYFGIKLLLVVLCVMFSNLFLGAVVYTLGSIGYAFFNKTHPLARIMVIPALIIGIPLLVGVMRLGWFLMVLIAAIAAIYDIREAATLVRVANAYKD